jgi:hypothetical protein
VVPAAKKFEEAITRNVLHRALGWKELQFEWLGLDDPDENVQVNMVGRLYVANSITPDEIRERMQIGAPLPGGWGKLTSGQMQLVMAAAVGKPAGAGGGMGGGMGMGGTTSGMGGGSGPGMGMGMGGGMGMGASRSRRFHIEGSVPSLWASPFNAQDVSQMDPDTLELYRQAGLIPSDPNQLQTDMESQQPGILQTLSEELLEYFDWLEEQQEEQEKKPAKVTDKDQKGQAKKFADRQHQVTKEEKNARGRDFRSTVYEQGGYRGPVPRKSMFGPNKGKLPYTGRTR